MIEIDALLLIASKLRKNQDVIEKSNIFDNLLDMDIKIYEKIYGRNVDNIDVLSMLLFTKLSTIYSYDYDKMIYDLNK